MRHLVLSVLLIVPSVFALRASSAAHELPPVALVLDQADPGLLAYADMTAHLRSTLNRKLNNIILYAEILDLSRFYGSGYQKLQSSFLHVKYRDIRVGVIVASGARSLEYALTLATETWPGLPVVFSAVPDGAVDVAELPQNVTGQTIRVSTHDSLAAARAMVPNLRRITLAGDPLYQQTFRFHQVEELDQIRSFIEIVDLTGLSFREIAERVAHLPDHSAIMCKSIIEAHGDHIAVRLRPDRGMTFEVGIAASWSVRQ